MKNWIIASVMAIGLGTGAQAATLPTEFSSFWVLGDSLSDNGNLFEVTGETRPASPPYAEGRFSNGRVWNEDILSEFTDAFRPNRNFAFGGARTEGGDSPDLGTQLGLFTAAATPVLGANPLVSLWFGANDLFNSIGVSDAVKTAEDAADRVTTAAQFLKDTQGVDDFLIFNIPDLGLTPSYALFQPAIRPGQATRSGRTGWCASRRSCRSGTTPRRAARRRR